MHVWFVCESIKMCMDSQIVRVCAMIIRPVTVFTVYSVVTWLIVGVMKLIVHVVSITRHFSTT